MVTGVLAGVAGYLTVRSADLSNDAIYHSNQGVLHQAEISDAWAEYEADSIKANAIETQLSAGAVQPSAKAELEARYKELRDREPGLKAKAEGFRKDRDAELALGGNRLGEKNLLAYASMAVQLGIALASVAALTRRRSAFVSGVAVGLVGVAITTAALVLHYTR